MATHATVTSERTPREARPLLELLRLEGLAVALLTAILYGRTGAGWWMFFAFWLLPDLSLLGYLVNKNLGARVYNAIHAYVTPMTLAVCALLLHATALLPVALIWGNNIGVHRCLGFGLKYPSSWERTHLGTMGALLGKHE